MHARARMLRVREQERECVHALQLLERGYLVNLAAIRLESPRARLRLVRSIGCAKVAQSSDKSAELKALELLAFQCDVARGQCQSETSKIATKHAWEIINFARSAIVAASAERAEDVTLTEQYRELISENAEHLIELTRQSTRRSTIRWVIATLDRAHQNVVDGCDLTDVAKGIESSASRRQEPILASVEGWKKAILGWHGYVAPRRGTRGKRPNRPGLPKSYRWDVIVFLLLNPKAHEHRIEKEARSMRDEYDRSSGGLHQKK